ncbi:MULTISPECIES: HDOD domain-containing protein [unclassified Undibacterium]|uniref:HDOD domain-containing protein n=1 Tax=unclassified Undibacterium TaxID=2630295 RepID=UPI002AC99B49|nr:MULTISPECIES: HDOD domain-containing protein [unclassified Undibacterium]MEB0139170.1 HDOD domain-containing protein [Undibacterium sp. CCC2.1]MEB0172255.1 HDOD domain-containing protein [Undibacterium sp. CCC1.1]MEB0175888.1 HDOD domain-containing protein [Undibacterium sp. CCC3.4]MEB0215252.1 HDOD domain-containing protein [Undibacterium sp. 5I2]WPX43550.1 HDOD domain-containing protein [Undibacterium sp. CCC3.4]
MNRIAIQQIVEEIKDLPTLPAVVMEILNQIDSDQVDTHELAQKVTHDIALTAKTLRYANSAYYSTLVKVTTIQQAIGLLGLVTVRQLIVTAALTGCFPENNCAGFSHKQFWEHSNTVAIVAKILARRLHVSQDVAFTAGLLHDIGTLVLVTYHGRAYEAVLAAQREQALTQLQAEHQVLGIDHAEVGTALARQWNFSEQMINAISGHHQPETPGLGFLATIVHVANGIAHVLHLNHTPDHSTPEITALSWQHLGLDQDVLDQVLLEASAEFLKLQQQVLI